MHFFSLIFNIIIFPFTEMEFIFNLQKQGKWVRMLVYSWKKNSYCESCGVVVWAKGYTNTHEPSETLVKCDVLLKYDPLTLLPTCQLATQRQRSLQTAWAQNSLMTFIVFLISKTSSACLQVSMLLMVHEGSVNSYSVLVTPQFCIFAENMLLNSQEYDGACLLYAK